LVAANSGDPCAQLSNYLFKRFNFSQPAAEIRLAFPKALAELFCLRDERKL
jgi:hypothetical protein